MLHFEPRFLRMDLPRTETAPVDVRRWRARLRSFDPRSAIEPLRAIDPRIITAGAGLIVGALAVLALGRAGSLPASAPAPTIARTEASAEAPCARQTWPYLDRRCVADTREATPRLITTDNLARAPNSDANAAPAAAPAAEARREATAADGKDANLRAATSEPLAVPSAPRQLYANEPSPDRLEPRRPRWTGFDFEGRGRFSGRRRVFRPFSRDDPMTRLY